MDRLKRLKLFLFLALVSCKVDYKPVKAKPLAEGKCTILQYVGNEVTEAVCAFEGYYWHCNYNACERDRLIPSEQNK